MTSLWRLIVTPPASGALNMALDEAFLISTSNKIELPTLRLYSWNPPTLSLGFAQNFTDVNLEVLSQLGWDLVRRPTGGRAILHTDELTYSITAPLDDPVVQGTLLESYHRISSALLAALASLGISANANMVYESDQSKKKEPVCFEVPSNFEVTVSGKKLIGSAQARKNGGVLQHGSLPLNGDLTRIIRALNYPSEEKRLEATQRLLDHAGTIHSLTGKYVTLQEAQNAFITAFAKILDLEFQQSNPSDSELSMAKELEKTKYGSKDWNQRL